MGILDDAIREHLELKRRHGADSQEVSRQEREILGAEAEAAAAAAAAYDNPGGVVVPPAVEEPEYADYAEPVAEIAPVAEPLAGSPLATPEPAAAPPYVAPADDIFPGTGELLAAASETPAAPPRPPAPAAPAPVLKAPAPSDADSETAARSGARRLSDDELAAWRRRLSERADRLAAQRPGAPEAPASPAPGTGAPRPPAAAPQAEPPAYWSGNTSGKDVGTPPPVAPAPSLAKPEAAPQLPESGVPVDFFDAGDAASAFAPEAAPEPAPAEDGHDVLDETPDFLEETPEHDRMWFEQRPPRDFDFG